MARLSEQQRDRLACGMGTRGRVRCARVRRGPTRALARVACLIARLFHQRYSLRGVSILLHRMGYSPQVSAIIDSMAV